jgi:hypothetical protein
VAQLTNQGTTVFYTHRSHLWPGADGNPPAATRGHRRANGEGFTMSTDQYLALSDEQIPPANELEVLAFKLRSLRARSRRSYDEMAASAHFAKSTLAGADKGRRLPTLPVLGGYVAACGGDITEFLPYWHAAAGAITSRRRAPRTPRSLPNVRDVIDQADFVRRLGAVRLWAGLTYREVSNRVELHGLDLPHSTLWDILNRYDDRMPARPVIDGYLRACGVPEQDVDLWLAVYDRLTRTEVFALAWEPADDASESVPVQRTGRTRFAVATVVLVAAILALSALIGVVLS